MTRPHQPLFYHVKLYIINMGKRKKNVGVDAKHVHGKLITSLLSATSGVGAVTVDKFEIDTDLCTTWQNLAKVFNKWRIKKLVFEVTSNLGPTSQVGMVMCMIEDGNSTAPGVLGDFLQNRFSSFKSFGTSKMKPLVYVPDRTINDGWMFTNDQVTSDDRFEMPGDFYIGTWGCNTSLSNCFYVVITYDVEFCELTNSIVSSVKPSLTPKMEGENPPAEEEKFRKWLALKADEYVRSVVK